jgi:hypothetical protein
MWAKNEIKERLSVLGRFSQISLPEMTLPGFAKILSFTKILHFS